ncbi:MAG: SGNH/GDSL hydrolase family protein [Lachnospiraceae bacterium]|nr:SGNH/GDSL hydrolase family protein [Lachnospiraceae bacterium]
MGNFFKNNDFRTDYKKRPNDAYKHLYNQLDDETKKKFARQRSFILVGVVILVFILVIVLAVTGIGTNKAQSIANILGGTDTVKISGLGDNTSYLQSLEESLESRLSIQVETLSFRDAEGKATNTSYKGFSEKGDIVIIMYTLENYLEDEEAEGILEANIDGLSNQGCLVYLVNYPTASFAEKSAYTAAANGFINRAAKNKNILLMDAATYFKNITGQSYTEDELFDQDGIHLSEEGCRLLGQFIADGLIKEAGLD